jgi:RNA polymerase sigma factor for flagellar operon FliA
MKTSNNNGGSISSEAALALWREYKETGDQRLRDRLVLTFAPLVKYIVYKKTREIPARCDAEDFISCGLEALIRSIDRFDPDKGATLETYAWTRIHGAVLDELRHHDWAPRSVRRWERDISRAREQFVGLYGRRASTAELSDAMGIPVDELHGHLHDIARSDVGSLNSIIVGEEDTEIERIDTLPSTDESLDPAQQAIRSDAVARLRVALDNLPARERTVAVLLYVENLRLHEIGEVIGVSESRVSQIHTQLRKRIREELAADAHLFLAVA